MSPNPAKTATITQDGQTLPQPPAIKKHQAFDKEAEIAMQPDNPNPVLDKRTPRNLMLQTN